jgi:hypothetical protein
MSNSAADIKIFYTKDKFLTSYGFACGYVERKESLLKSKQMYFEHGVYHVRAGKHGNESNIWETFSTLTEAKKFYKAIKL